MLSEEMRYRAMRLLEANPGIGQPGAAHQSRMSLDKCKHWALDRARHLPITSGSVV
jgi:hypothetical protein